MHQFTRTKNQDQGFLDDPSYPE